jgi:hypothetical protein
VGSQPLINGSSFAFFGRDGHRIESFVELRKIGIAAIEDPTD